MITKLYKWHSSLCYTWQWSPIYTPNPSTYTDCNIDYSIQMTEFTKLYTYPTNLYRYHIPLISIKNEVHQPIHHYTHSLQFGELPQIVGYMNSTAENSFFGNSPNSCVSHFFKTSTLLPHIVGFSMFPIFLDFINLLKLPHYVGISLFLILLLFPIL